MEGCNLLGNFTVLELDARVVSERGELPVLAERIAQIGGVGFVHNKKVYYCGANIITFGIISKKITLKNGDSYFQVAKKCKNAPFFIHKITITHQFFNMN